MTYREGVLRAAKLHVDAERARAEFYAGLPALGSAALRKATETRQNMRMRGHARPSLAPRQEAVRLRTSVRVITAAQPRRRRQAVLAALRAQVARVARPSA